MMIHRCLPQIPIHKHKLLFVLFLAYINVFGGLMFGYNLASVAGSLSSFQNQFKHKFEKLSTFGSSLVLSLLAAVYLFGAAIGSLMGGPIANILGRKLGVLVIVIVSTIGTVLASAVPVFEVVIIGRCFQGFGVGCACVICPLYVVEMVDPKRRGQLATVFQIGMNSGIIFAYVFSIAFLKSKLAWRGIFGISGVFPVALFIAFIIMPESTVWLNKRLKKGTVTPTTPISVNESTTQLNQPFVENEVTSSNSIPDPALEKEAVVSEIKAEIEEVTEYKRSSFISILRRLFCTFRNLKFFILGLSLGVAAQWTGINALTFFAPIMFGNAGWTKLNVYLATLGLGFARLIASASCSLVIDKVGRKPLLLTGTLIMSLAMLGLSLAYSLAKPSVVVPVAIVLMIIFIVGFNVGAGPLPYILFNEFFIHDPEVKEVAVALMNGAQWFMSLPIGLFYLPLAQQVGHAVMFGIFGGIGIICFIIFAIFVPETSTKKFTLFSRLFKRIKKTEAEVSNDNPTESTNESPTKST
jgi:MFS family permease